MPFSLFTHRTFFDKTPQNNTQSISFIPLPFRSKMSAFAQKAARESHSKLSYRERHVYWLTDASEAVARPLSGTMKVTVIGSDEDSIRTWFLPKALLDKHSQHFSKLLSQDPERAEVVLEHVEPHDFDNLVAFMRSSIYSLNSKVANYRAVSGHAAAYVLGEKLGVKVYSAAATRQLYALFEPLARSRSSNMRKSPIHASDINFICTNTTAPVLGNPAPRAGGVRQMFFDTVASHWTQIDVLCITGNDTPDGTVSWAHVYSAHKDFRMALATSLHMADAWRAALLRPVDDYLDQETGSKLRCVSRRDQGPAARPYTDDEEEEVERRLIAAEMAREEASWMRPARGRRGRGETQALAQTGLRYESVMLTEGDAGYEDEGHVMDTAAPTDTD